MIDFGDELFTITVDIKLSNQNVGRSRHWSSAAKVKQRWIRALSDSADVNANGIVYPLMEFHHEVLNDAPISQRVGIVTTRVLGKGERLWDMDSIGRGDIKESIDSLVTHGILKDDSPRHLAWWLGQQDDTKRTHGPLVLHTFYGAK